MAQSSTDRAALDPRRRRQLLHLLKRVIESEQEVWDALLGLLEQVLEIEQDGLVGEPGVNERRGNTGLAAPPGTSDPVHVVLNFLRPEAGKDSSEIESQLFDLWLKRSQIFRS